MISKTYKKFKLRLWSIIVTLSRNKFYYPWLYKSYWKAQFGASSLNIDTTQYVSAVPNQGAGIGHQIANWNAGFWFAKQFDLNFAHMPFSTKKWEDFLGFGFDEVSVSDLIKNKGYKKIKIPLFDEKNNVELSLIQKIIKSYKGSKVVFVCEQDQFYRDQFGILNQIQQKFYNAPSRKKDMLRYDASDYNVAIHVRRGDIVPAKDTNPNHNLRWLNNDYFVTVLQNTLDLIKTNKKVTIYLFSQGLERDFTEFKKFSNLEFCLDFGAIDSFLHMVYVDVLICSKSSFSYKPALLNNGIKVCPKNFWHGYPNNNQWILAENDGKFNGHLLNNLA